MRSHLGGNQGANRNSISHKCYLFEVTFVWVLTKATTVLGCLQGGDAHPEVLLDMQGAVLALVVRQKNTNLWAEEGGVAGGNSSSAPRASGTCCLSLSLALFPHSRLPNPRPARGWAAHGSHLGTERRV